jgi:PPM family protein phosphatase
MPSQLPIYLVSAGSSHPGFVRPNNEDSFGVHSDLGLFLVADGVGGHEAGEVASRMAVDSTSAYLQSFSLPPAPETEPGSVISDGSSPATAVLSPPLVESSPIDSAPETLLAAIHNAHQAIQKAADADENLLTMGTTLVAAWRPNGSGRIYLAHIGDSRAYLLRRGKLKCLTEDHSYLNELKHAGFLPKNQRDWPPRNILSQALGVSDEINPDISSLDLQPQDRLLLSSDGFYELFSDREIARLLSAHTEPNELCKNLVLAALQNGAEDNVTVVVVEARS